MPRRCGCEPVITTTKAGKPIEVDGCIAPMVDALNAAGIETVASCCGHGNRPGSVILRDGRWLSVHSDKASWCRAEEPFELDCNGDIRTEPMP